MPCPCSTTDRSEARRRAVAAGHPMRRARTEGVRRPCLECSPMAQNASAVIGQPCAAVAGRELLNVATSASEWRDVATSDADASIGRPLAGARSYDKSRVPACASVVKIPVVDEDKAAASRRTPYRISPLRE